MNTSEQSMRELAARNPIRDADIRDSTGGQRRSLAHAWTDAGVGDATSSGVLSHRDVSPRQSGRGGLLLVAASVAVLMGGTAVVTSGVAEPLVGWVAGEDATADRPAPEDLYEPDTLAGADLSGISEAQAVEIVDRVVTEEENRAAYERYRQCLSAAGFEISKDPILMPDGTFMGGGLSDAAVQSGVADECYEREWRFTDTLFQSRPEFQNLPAETQWIRDCLEARGIQPTDAADELYEQLQREGIHPPECSE